MSYKLINEALNDIPKLRYNHRFSKITTNTVDNEDDYSETTEIYSLGQDNLHIKLVLRTDSYGDNEFVHSVQIVKPIIKQITDFELID